MKKLVLAFDMDNTLVKTDEMVFKIAIEYCENHGMKRSLDELIACRDIKGNYDRLSQETKDIIYKEVIEKRFYMDLAEGSNIVNDGFGGHLSMIKVLFPEVENVICTHRGDNDEAKASTVNWLDKKGLIKYFDTIHSISHINNPDKISYLKEVYGEDVEIILVDDNPFGSSSKVREKSEYVLVCDKVVSLPCHKNQDKFLDMEHLIKIIAKKLA